MLLKAIPKAVRRPLRSLFQRLRLESWTLHPFRPDSVLHLHASMCEASNPGPYLLGAFGSTWPCNFQEDEGSDGEDDCLPG